MSSIKCGNRTVEITHEDKILFPSRITKHDLIKYYNDIAPFMLPYLKNRPLTMHRFPHGITQEGFYQKNIGEYFPGWIDHKKIKNKETPGSTDYLVCNKSATLVYLANQACITPHVWLSTIDKLDYPDRMIFDLDPPGTNFALVRHAAKELKKLLEDIGHTPFVMTTGSRGLHVVVPLNRRANFDRVRDYAHDIAQILAQTNQKQFTTNPQKKARRGKLFIDYLRNSYGATAVAPYSVRAIKGAPVATPLEWREVTTNLSPQRYTIKNIFRHLSSKGDVWKDMKKYASGLKELPE